MIQLKKMIIQKIISLIRPRLPHPNKNKTEEHSWLARSLSSWYKIILEYNMLDEKITKLEERKSTIPTNVM